MWSVKNGEPTPDTGGQCGNGRALAVAVVLMMCLPSSGFAASTHYFPNLKGETVERIELGPGPEKPAILLLVVDTIRPDRLGAYGHDRPTSPFLDSLAADGVLFANHFSNSTWTKPSMASIFTGLYPGRHQVLPIASKLSGSIPTLAQMFQDAGFKTGAVVANSFAGRRYRLDRGFQKFAQPSTHFKGKSPEAEDALALAYKWIKEDKDEAFFYTVFLFDPHDPYKPPPKYKDEFCPDCSPPEIVTPWREYHGRGPSAKQVEDMKNLFDAEIRYADDRLEVFFDQLEKLGIRERLSVIVCGDHAEAFGEHRVFEHAFHPWDEVIRTPMILQSPRIEARGVYKGMTQHVDILPTLLTLADIDLPPGLQGVSLVQNPGDPSVPDKRLVVTEVEMYGIHRVTIRNEDYKLIHHNPLDLIKFRQFYQDSRIYPSVVIGTDKRELYHISVDPYEQRDVYQEQRSKALPLERMLERYLLTGGLEEDALPEAPSDEVLEDLKSLGYIQ